LAWQESSSAGDNEIVMGSADLAVELQKVYDSEINLEIGWLWDGGIEIRLGDKVNGFLAEETVASMAEIIPWVREAIAHFYPNSAYAATLDLELKERASQRIFLPPRTGATVICPHCGAPHASIKDELIAFVCPRCGNSVEVKPPEIQ
jgi:predicted RNA-binding Zn-ribbon protein involved in translation (DUF1610 family)